MARGERNIKCFPGISSGLLLVVGEYPTSNINAINADLLEVAKLDNVMELQFLDRCISCYSRIRDQNATTTVGGEIINSKRFISTLA